MADTADDGSVKQKIECDANDLEKAIRWRVNEIWLNYDEDGSGALDKPEAKKFTTHILK